MKDVGIYIHIPFCKSKCFYCDFLSYANKNELIEKYIKWLKYEIQQVGQGNKLDHENNLDDLVNVKTIYIGGGTPSNIDSKYIAEILDTIKENFKLDNPEITIEVNPGTVDEEKLKNHINSGINRLSIGLQTTNNKLLKSIGRIHLYEDFLETYTKAKKVGFENINIDLMLGLPSQTVQDLEDSIEKVLKLNPQHISIYSLIIEENTKLEELLNNNTLKLPDENVEREMYWKTKKILEQHDFIHYEISNFALKDYESKHNLDCWNQKEYIGFGVGAHSYTNNVRFSNIDNIEEYIKNFENNKEENNFIFHEKQNKMSKMKEYMMLGLRKIEGVHKKSFKEKFDLDLSKLFKTEIDKLVLKDLIEENDEYIYLTSKGLDLANIVWEEFI